MNFFEKYPLFLRDKKNLKIKEISHFAENIIVEEIFEALKKYEQILNGEPRKVNAIIPVCWDGSTAGRPGARFAPQKIIEKIINLSLNRNFKNSLLFLPFVKVIIGEKDKTFDNIEKYVENVLKLLEHNVIPFFIGGDHSITEPIIGKYIKYFGKINLLVFDSHFDLRTVDEGLSGGTYLNSLKTNYKEDLNVIILGINHAANPDYLYEKAREFNVRYLDNLECFDVENIIEFLICNLQKDLPTYISLDTDSIDINYIDSVNSPYSFGLLLNVVLKVVWYLFDNYRVVGMDVVEFNPLVGDVERSVSNLVHLLYYVWAR